MTKVVRFHQFGGPEVLQIEDLPAPRPNRGEALLHVRAVAVTSSDVTLYRGTSASRPDLPARVGSEGAGIVEAIGPDVDPGWLGKRVSTLPTVAMQHYRLLAEAAIVPVSALAETPDGFSDAECCGLWAPYLAAYTSFVEGAHVSQGDLVLIICPCAGLGLAAVQLAKAEKAIAIVVVDTRDLKHLVATVGADYVVVAQEEDFVSRMDRILQGRRLRAVLGALGNPVSEYALEMVLPGGTFIEPGEQPTNYSLGSRLPRNVNFIRCQPDAITENTARLAVANAYIYDRLRFGYFSRGHRAKGRVFASGRCIPLHGIQSTPWHGRHNLSRWEAVFVKPGFGVSDRGDARVRAVAVRDRRSATGSSSQGWETPGSSDPKGHARNQAAWCLRP